MYLDQDGDDDVEEEGGNGDDAQTPHEEPPPSPHDPMELNAEPLTCIYCQATDHEMDACPSFSSQSKTNDCKNCSQYVDCICEHVGSRKFHEGDENYLKGGNKRKAEHEQRRYSGVRSVGASAINKRINSAVDSIKSSVGNNMSGLTPNGMKRVGEGIYNNFEEQFGANFGDNVDLDKHMLDTMKSNLAPYINSRDPEKLKIVRLVVGLCMNNTSVSGRAVANRLGVTPGQVQFVKNLMNSEEDFSVTTLFHQKRKATRAVPDTLISLAKDFWLTMLRESPCAKDFCRLRIGVKNYEQHKMFHQTESDYEIYCEFLRLNPSCVGKISFSFFKDRQRCKPYYARRLNQRDVCLNATTLKLRLLFRALTNKSGNLAKWKRPGLKKQVNLKVFVLLSLDAKLKSVLNESVLKSTKELILSFYKVPCCPTCDVHSKKCLLNFPSRISAFLDSIMCPKT